MTPTLAEHKHPSVAVIGCGAWGKNLVRNFHGLGALATVVELDPVIRAGLVKDYGIELQDMTAVLANPAIEGVVVALAARHHYEIGKQVLAAKKHLYVEKPLTMSYVQAQELINLAEQNNCILMVGHLPRYHPAFQKLVELVKEGEIGQLHYIYSHRLNLGRIRRDENVLWDLAPHDLSMVMAVTEAEPMDTATHSSCIMDPTIMDSAMVHMTFPGGVKGHIYNSWMHPFKEHRFVVMGSQGMMVFDDTQPWESKLVIYHHVIEKLDELNFKTEYREGIAVHLEQSEPLRLECEHFLDCIAGGGMPLTGSIDALRVMKVLEQIQQVGI